MQQFCRFGPTWIPERALLTVSVSRMARLVAPWVLAAACAASPALAQTSTEPTPPAAAAQPEPPPPPAPTMVPVPSLPPAGVIPSQISLNVTGSPADGGFLANQIVRALDRAIRPTLRAGSSIRFGTIVPWPLPSLNSGDRAAATVSVTIAGDTGSSWVSGVTSVDIANEPIAVPSPSVLYLSDDPEYINSTGLVFRGTVADGRPTRLYYYHSDRRLPHDLDVVLTASKPARVHVVQSAAGPDLDVMSVGQPFRATRCSTRCSTRASSSTCCPAFRSSYATI